MDRNVGAARKGTLREMFRITMAPLASRAAPDVSHLARFAAASAKRNIGGPTARCYVATLLLHVGPMPTTTLTSREFNQDVGRAKKASKSGPVIITDRGAPAHVLLSIEEYRKLTHAGLSLAQAIAEAEPTDFDFEPPQMKLKARISDLS